MSPYPPTSAWDMLLLQVHNNRFLVKRRNVFCIVGTATFWYDCTNFVKDFSGVKFEPEITNVDRML